MHAYAEFAQLRAPFEGAEDAARPRRYLRVLPTRTRPSLFGGD